MEDLTVEFHAIISPTASAIRVDGGGGGIRLQLDIPESEMLEVVSLLGLRETLLYVTVQVVEE